MLTDDNDDDDDDDRKLANGKIFIAVCVGPVHFACSQSFSKPNNRSPEAKPSNFCKEKKSERLQYHDLQGFLFSFPNPLPASGPKP